MSVIYYGQINIPVLVYLVSRNSLVSGFLVGEGYNVCGFDVLSFYLLAAIINDTLGAISRNESRI